MKPNEPIDLAKAQTICIIQLTRMGDLLQTLQAAQLFKKRYPQIRLILVCRKQFYKALHSFFTETFAQVYALDYEHFIAPSPDQSPLTAALQRLRRWLSAINEEDIEVAVNLSFSLSSSYLTKLIKAKHYLGLSRRNNNELEILGNWAMYLYATTMGGSLNPFSLVDLYQLMLAPPATSPAPNEVAPKSETIWRPATLPADWAEREWRLVVHPFASHGKKTWKIHKWGEVIYKIARQLPSLKITIVGSPADVKDGQQLEDMALIKQVIGQLEWKIGKLSIRDLATNMAKAKLLLAADSMAQQLTMISHTPAVILALGCVRPAETTAYAPYHLVLAPRRKCFPCFLKDPCPDLACHANLSESIVVQIVTEYLSNQGLDLAKFKQRNSAFYREGVSLWASEFDARGLFNLKPLVGGQDLRDIFRQLYRVVFAYDLGQIECPAPFPEISGPLRQILQQHQQGLNYLSKLYQFGKTYSQAIIQELAVNPPALDKIKANTQKIAEIEDLQGILKKTYPFLAPIIDFGLVRKANLAGANLVQIAESSYFTYERSLWQAQALQELIQQTINHYQNFASI